MSQDIETYYINVVTGSLACIRRTDAVYGDQFIFTRVIDAANSKIVTAYGVFWAINGERCDQRWRGDANQLVVPTMTRLEAAETHMANTYQFGIDRTFEIAAARAVLEQRSTVMPDIPPPPVPNLEKAEAELNAAMAYWMSLDNFDIPPGKSIHAHREASERLATAKLNYSRAKAVYGASDNLKPDIPVAPIARAQNPVVAPDHVNHNAPGKFSLSTGKLVQLSHNDVDASAYMISISSLSEWKSRDT